jgi:acyl-CoA synthetase (AMP-forming)/AMP-acid ligase II
MDVTREALVDWCAARLAPEQVPGRVIFSAVLPRNTVGKVTKYVLVERFSSGAPEGDE